MKKKSEFLLKREELAPYFSQLGNRLQMGSKHLRPLLKPLYKEMADVLRTQKTLKKWKPVQLDYCKAYKAERAKGQSPKKAHLWAKSIVLKRFVWVHERDLGKDTKRGIIPY